MKEKIKTSEFIQHLKGLDYEFRETCEYESDKYALSFYLGNEHSAYFYDFNVDYENFLYEFIEVQTEKGDGKDETTRTGIFKRLSDGKHFALVIHDAGFVGPGTITVNEYMHEVEPHIIQKKIWK